MVTLVTLILHILPFLPLLGNSLPVGHLARLNSLLLTYSLVSCLIPCTLCLHISNCSIVKNLYCSTTNSLLQLFFAESFARLVEVSDIKLVDSTKIMTYKFLLRSIARIL